MVNTFLSGPAKPSQKQRHSRSLSCVQPFIILEDGPHAALAIDGIEVFPDLTWQEAPVRRSERALGFEARALRTSERVSRTRYCSCHLLRFSVSQSQVRRAADGTLFFRGHPFLNLDGAEDGRVCIGNLHVHLPSNADFVQ